MTSCSPCTAAASEINKKAGFASMKVYGLLTDMGTFEFFAFDPVPSTFYQDPIMLVARKRLDFMQDMIGGMCLHVHCCDTRFYFSVVNTIFSILLQGFIDTLVATCAKSQERAATGNICVFSILNTLPN